jgi:hypothetical protein
MWFGTKSEILCANISKQNGGKNEIVKSACISNIFLFSRIIN